MSTKSSLGAVPWIVAGASVAVLAFAGTGFSRGSGNAAFATASSAAAAAPFGAFRQVGLGADPAPLLEAVRAAADG